MAKNVLLIGWFNAKARHMAKYIKMYNTLGIERTQSLLYQSSSVLSLTRGFDFCSRYSQNNILDNHYNIIHTFSGGSIIAFYLKHIGITYDKIIFDSGPMYLTTSCFTNYICNNPEKGFNLRRHTPCNFIKPSIKLFIDSFWTLERLNCPSVLKLNNLLRNDYESSEFLFSDHPKLVINNKNDKLILHDKVIEMNKNNNISFQYFNNSKHVQHYKSYPFRYTQIVKNFL